MKQFTTISIPADVADEIDEIHDEVAEEFAPKWATVQRACASSLTTTTATTKTTEGAEVAVDDRRRRRRQRDRDARH